MSIINKINLYRDNSPMLPILPYSGDTYGGNPNKLVFSIQNDSSQPILNANKFSLRSNVRNIGSWDRNGVHRSVSEPITIPLN